MRPDLRTAIEERLAVAVVSMQPIRGGDINEAYRVALADGTKGDTTVFVKAHRSPPPGFFAAEADGLRRLSGSGAVAVPEVLAVSDVDPSFLALEWVQSARLATDHDEQLGRSLATLHSAPCPTFGLDRGNYVGSNAQDNTPCDSWAEFLAERRLVPMFRQAVDRVAIPVSEMALLDRVLGRLPDLVGPAEPPSLLHGDLWAGNAITDATGQPVLIDPAVYGGHREIDLAMMRLFGGFSSRVFDAYDDAAPLADGHRDRVRLYQLPPLLVHAILFGGGYGTSATDVLRAYA